MIIRFNLIIHSKNDTGLEKIWSTKLDNQKIMKNERKEEIKIIHR
jgi:hypothetical protein